MDFKVIWSDAAIADLHEACAYIAKHDPEAASRMGRGILDHVRILASFPLIGRPTLAALVVSCARLFFVPTAFSTTYLNNLAASKSFMFGMEPARSHRFKTPFVN